MIQLSRLGMTPSIPPTISQSQDLSLPTQQEVTLFSALAAMSMSLVAGSCESTWTVLLHLAPLDKNAPSKMASWAVMIQWRLAPCGETHITTPLMEH